MQINDDGRISRPFYGKPENQLRIEMAPGAEFIDYEHEVMARMLFDYHIIES